MADNHISLEEVANNESVITKEFRSEAEGYKFYNDFPFVDIFLKTRCIFRVTKRRTVDIAISEFIVARRSVDVENLCEEKK
ncbi:hypothetical protein DAI22_04g184900 [Oryza sativa Japonica Group]|nr:hypothetical protein DAI22_04g184900 [Oryza sativa Japonica Group]